MAGSILHKPPTLSLILYSCCPEAVIAYLKPGLRFVLLNYIPMRKAIVIVVAVAILGVLALFNSKHSSQPDSAATTTNTPTTSATTTPPSSDTGTQETSSALKDGTFTGTAVSNPYGTVQVAAVISGGKIADINFLQMPFEEGHSVEVTNFSKPLLKNSAINKQSAQVDFVSGATDTSISFRQSLQAALNQAAS
jgi:uncharacterized protein with FMN-binding domain